MEQKAVCIAPIDWGLGHATRCIALIRALTALNYTIYIASEGHQETILKEAFPEAHFLKLKGYRVRYAKKGALLIPILLFQLPKIIAAIVKEYYWLKRKSKQFHFDLIISDNRFGFFHKKIKSVFITHQLELQTPFSWSTKLFQSITCRFLKNYAACWVADMQPPNHLAGALSGPNKMPETPIWYMNCLSRLQDECLDNTRNTAQKTSTHFLGIVSGPEPQRTLLENKLWEQGNKLKQPFVVVAGLPNKNTYHQQTTHGLLYHHLTGDALKKEIEKAEYIICRGGYTSLMELIPFKKKLIFIPTPGQTEQEYLGKYWQEKKWAISFKQDDFNLNEALAIAHQFKYEQPPFIAFNSTHLLTQLKHLFL
jgi:hypothetical protein